MTYCKVCKNECNQDLCIFVDGFEFPVCSDICAEILRTRLMRAGYFPVRKESGKPITITDDF